MPALWLINQVLTVPLFKIAQNWKQPNVPQWENEYTNSCLFYKMKIYSAVKRNLHSMYVKTWVSVTNIPLSLRNLNTDMKEYILHGSFCMRSRTSKWVHSERYQNSSHLRSGLGIDQKGHEGCNKNIWYHQLDECIHLLENFKPYTWN